MQHKIITTKMKKDKKINLNSSSQTNVAVFSSDLLDEVPKLHPWFVTGFSDAESCFSISILRRRSLSISSNNTDVDISKSNNWAKIGVEAEFQIGLNIKDVELLHLIKASFEDSKANSITSSGKVGRIQLDKNKCFLRVSSLRELAIIIEHFDKYPLLTKKRQDFLIWREVVQLMMRKEHQTYEGVRYIIKLKSALNLGLSDKLRREFNITYLEEEAAAEYKAKLGNEELPLNPQWVAGFTSGEGNFMISLKKEGRLGKTPQLRFQLSQHLRDERLFLRLASYLECGKVYLRNNNTRQAVEFSVLNFTDNVDKIIPLFRSNAILGIKTLDFEDWSKASEIMKVKGHLTQEGLDQICQLKAGMNKGRYTNSPGAAYNEKWSSTPR
uniref:LAGLIDADG endonuclease n=1 Tax=Chrysoporthe deuterocubensis TaxID=764597 RepID=A0A191MXA6_9PEZI|nr:LAGLIDADG endonuclease [Chrysoporthe deuterocubensis]AMX22188.1 LAGLIDADG endonuclease [Chrysoporthe deuterocubensis]